MRLIDLHNHMLPFCDDGAQTMDDALLMIERSVQQGVTHIVFTPHVQSKAQKVDRKAQREIFDALFTFVKEKEWPVELFLGAEIQYHSHLGYAYDDYTFGNQKNILIEFSPHQKTDVESVIYDLVQLGFHPIIAHIERYPYLTLEDYQNIRHLGALFQMNASAAINKDPYLSNQKLPDWLLKKKWVDLIASDAHHLEKKPPNLKMAYDIMKTRYDSTYLDEIFYTNALNLLK